MTEPQTSRPFRERFLDGFDRSQLRQEVQKVKPRKLSGLRRKAAGWALGASLALGGIGIPLKMGHMLQSADANAPQPAAVGERSQRGSPQPARQGESPGASEVRR